MKRIVSILLEVLLVFCLAGCANVTQDTHNPQGSVSRGSIKGNTYTSTSSDLTFTKPSQWRYLTDKELAHALSIPEDAISEKEFAKSLNKYPSLIDMMVMDDSTGLNMTVGYENISVTMGGVITEAEYMEAMTDHLKTMGDMTVGESVTVKLSGQEYLKTTCSVEIDGILMKTDYYIRGIDTFMNVITVAYTANIATPEIEKMFS